MGGGFFEELGSGVGSGLGSGVGSGVGLESIYILVSILCFMSMYVLSMLA